MAGLVDYAGLFPPAALDMETAVEEFAGHLGESEAWMLGRFIVPVGRLPELAEAAQIHGAALGQWAVSVLLGHRKEAKQSLTLLPVHCQAFGEFEKKLQGRARLEVLEIPWPEDLLLADYPEFFRRYQAGLADFTDSSVQVFYEIPAQLSLESEQAFFRTLANGSGLEKPAGVKLRCGGVTAQAFPSVDRVARVIAGCRDFQLPLKFTAGLHHPVRHQAQEPLVMMHGFLNVFGASLLAHELGWDAAQLARVIGDTDHRSFAFEADVFRWRDHTVGTAVVKELHHRFLGGFGSCSFAEPRDDLQDLGLL